MAKERGRAGTHTSIIEAAKPLIAALDKVCRVSRGIIKANAKSQSRTIKLLEIEGGYRLTIVAKNAKQEFHLYNISVAQVKEILENPIYRSFEKNLPNK